jgi:hypothetical protein
MTVGYGSQRLGIRFPPVGVCLIRMVGGGVQVLIVLISAFYTYRYAIDAYPELQVALREGVSSNSTVILALTTLVHMLLVVIFLLAGLRSGLQTAFIDGLLRLLLPRVWANIPDQYVDPETRLNNGIIGVGQAFRERVIKTYESYPNNQVVKWLGYTTMFLPPSTREVVEKLGASIQRQVGRLFVGILLLAGFFGLNSTLARASLPVDLQSVLALGNPTLIVAPIVGYILLQIIVGVLEVIPIFMLVPRTQPNTVAHEGTEVYRGFGHPEQVLSRLPELEIPLRWQEFINRVDRFPVLEQASSSVGDAGTFSSGAFIESQPQPIPTPGRMAGYYLTLVGWFFYLLGFASMLLLVYIPKLSGGSLATLVFLGLLALFAITGAMSGSFLIKQGEKLILVYRFRSTAIWMDLSGNLYRSDVRLGKGFVDSIESSNVMVRSDFTTRFWAAEMISEGPIRIAGNDVDWRRDLLALNQTDEAAYWLQYFRTGLQKLRSEGVRPAGVDLLSDEAQNLVQANIGMAAMRAGAMAKAQLQAADDAQQARLQPGAAQPSLPAFPAPVEESQPTRVCPSCGKVVRAQAKFCQGCGRSMV